MAVLADSAAAEVLEVAELLVDGNKYLRKYEVFCHINSFKLNNSISLCQNKF
ncbi:hypothetical protein D3C86_2238770 [compost metagenome]